MQVSKSYSGTIAVGSNSYRQVAFGNTSTKSVYQAKVDLVNECIADFLANTCGVEGVAYEERDGSTAKFLWIYDVPFLLLSMYNAESWYWYGPLTTSEISASMSLFSGSANGTYAFTLYFAGNPKTGFVLRVAAYNYSYPHATGNISILKCKNVCTQEDGIYVHNSQTVPSSVDTSGTSYTRNRLYLKDEEGTLLLDKAFGATTYSLPFVPWVGNNQSSLIVSMGDKIPLIPIYAGPYKLENIYCNVISSNSAVPDTVTASTASQTEFEMGGRKFINFGGGTNTNYINIGWMEVTDDLESGDNS